MAVQRLKYLKQGGMTVDEMNFEEALAKLKLMAEKIRDPEISLDESIRCYDEGMKYYEVCRKVLDNAKQKIEIFEGEV